MVRILLRPGPNGCQTVPEYGTGTAIIKNRHVKYMETIGEGLDIQFKTPHAVFQLHVQRIMAVIHGFGFVGYRCCSLKHDVSWAQMITVMGANDLNLV